MTHAERCHAESTRDVIFLLRYRLPRIGWIVDSVWLDRAEAEKFRADHSYRWSDSQVYGVPSSGQLAELLRRDPTLSCEWVRLRPADRDQGVAMTLTVAAAASHLGIGISTVRDAIRSGRLRHYRFGVGRGTIRIDPADLEDYRQRCLVGTLEPQTTRVVVPRELATSRSRTVATDASKCRKSL